MNKVMTATLAGLLALAAQAPASAAPQPPLAASCGAQADARLMNAHDRSRFVSACMLEGRKREKQAEKACTEAAAYKPPNERKKFMAECLQH